MCVPKLINTQHTHTKKKIQANKKPVLLSFSRTGQNKFQSLLGNGFKLSTRFTDITGKALPIKNIISFLQAEFSFPL